MSVLKPGKKQKGPPQASTYNLDRVTLFVLEKKLKESKRTKTLFLKFFLLFWRCFMFSVAQKNPKIG